MSISPYWLNETGNANSSVDMNFLDDTSPRQTTIGNWMISKINDVNNLSLNDTLINNDNISSFNELPNINIGAIVPIELGVPVYGYIAPIVILTTVLTNSFIVVVLSRPQLRSPTNRILLAISVTESLTGLASLPWFLYYYTFRGYVREEIYGLPPFWCRSFMYFSEFIPTIFHTTAIWLTVYLAIQRYVYVRSPVGAFYNFYRINMAIVIIFACSFLLELPMLFGRYAYPFVYQEKMACTFQTAEWMKLFYFYAHFWLFTVFVHAGPCALLVAFTGLLICTLNKAAYRRQHSLGNVGGGRALHATTKMLVVIIVIFLITEIPAAVIFILHVLQMTFGILSNDSYRSMNTALILRNVFILISYPFKFAVYLSMSNQFRTTVKNIFCPKYSTPIPKHSMACNNNNLCKQKFNSFDNCNGFKRQPSEQMDLLPVGRRFETDFASNI